jgi:hypothetical protein
MAKRCRRCQTVTSDQAPYCEACGIDFAAVPAVQPGTVRRLLVVSVMAVAIMALAYFRNC